MKLIRQEVRLAYLVNWQLKRLGLYKSKVGFKRYTRLVRALKQEYLLEDLTGIMVNGKVKTIDAKDTLYVQ